jgi:hypothetical protein
MNLTNFLIYAARNGYATVFEQDKPAWLTAYSGPIYAFLKDAMSQPEPDFPVRGPYLYQSGEWTYRLEPTTTNLAQFAATETITNAGKPVYVCYLIGGDIG